MLICLLILGLLNYHTITSLEIKWADMTLESMREHPQVLGFSLPFTHLHFRLLLILLCKAFQVLLDGWVVAQSVSAHLLVSITPSQYSLGLLFIPSSKFH
jgi:hypothetical protein